VSARPVSPIGRYANSGGLRHPPGRGGCESASNRDPSAIFYNPLILLAVFRSGWGPDRRRSGPQLGGDLHTGPLPLARAGEEFWVGGPVFCAGFYGGDGGRPASAPCSSARADEDWFALIAAGGFGAAVSRRVGETSDRPRQRQGTGAIGTKPCAPSACSGSGLLCWFRRARVSASPPGGGRIS
jgi:hypothetical protein